MSTSHWRPQRREHHPRADRATDRVREVVGSWRFLTVTAVALAALTGLAIRSDDRAGPVAVLGLLLSALCAIGLVVVLLVTGRAAATNDRRAAHDIESARRVASTLADLRDDLDGLHDELARTAARARRPDPGTDAADRS